MNSLTLGVSIHTSHIFIYMATLCLWYMSYECWSNLYALLLDLEYVFCVCKCWCILVCIQVFLVCCAAWRRYVLCCLETTERSYNYQVVSALWLKCSRASWIGKMGRCQKMKTTCICNQFAHPRKSKQPSLKRNSHISMGFSNAEIKILIAW